jgi:hypothetical protein
MRRFLLKGIKLYHYECDLVRHWVASKAWRKIHAWEGLLHFLYFSAIVIGAKEMYVGAAALLAVLIAISIFIGEGE